MSCRLYKPVRLHQDPAHKVKAFVSVHTSFLRIIDMQLAHYIKLKGGDILILRALRAVSARITFHYIYTQDDESGEELDFVFEESSQIEPGNLYEGIPLQLEFGAQTLDKLGVYTALEAPLAKYKGIGGKDRKRHYSEPKFTTATYVEYMTYGNEPQIMEEWASICMIASAPGHNIKSKWSQK
jgi:hypothetical protein